jgi:hypothetical protein
LSSIYAERLDPRYDPAFSSFPVKICLSLSALPSLIYCTYLFLRDSISPVRQALLEECHLLAEHHAWASGYIESEEILEGGNVEVIDDDEKIAWRN